MDMNALMRQAQNMQKQLAKYEKVQEKPVEKKKRI